MGNKQSEPVAMTLEQFGDAMMQQFRAQFVGKKGQDVADVIAKAAVKGEHAGHIIITNKPGQE